MILHKKLQGKEVIVLDGAVGSEIERLGGAMHARAWCAVANKTHPDIVRSVHEEYIIAGADVVTTNTFSTCRHVLAAADLAHETIAINTRAVELAKNAIDKVMPDRPVAVAGSMSNNLAWIPGTYSPDPGYIPTAGQEASDYRELAETLAQAGADLLVMEMMCDVERASRLTEAAIATGLPVWVGISCSLHADGSVTAWDMHSEEPADRLADDHQRQEPLALEEVIDAMISLGPDVIGIMHSTVQAMGPGLDMLFDRWEGPVMAYPEAAAGHDVGPAEFASYCRRWADDGVQIIGGCCGTTIDHIREMVSVLPASPGSRSNVQAFLT